MKGLQEHTRRTLIDALAKLRSDIMTNHIEADQSASGETARSLRVEETSSGAMLLGREYFGTLEDGRKAGAVPENFNDIIAQWIIDKGIAFEPIPYIRQESAKWQPKYTPEERGLMSLAGAIAHTIRTEGTQLHREGGRKDIFTPEIEIAKEKIKRSLAGIYKTEIQSINQGK